jgi:hypothetical protein
MNAKPTNRAGLENFNDVKPAAFGQCQIVRRSGWTDEKLKIEVFVLNRVSKMK